MPSLTLPSTFNNSFWSQDYRKGLEVLYSKLEQGVAENSEILAFVKARIHAERNFAATLGVPLPKEYQGVGFGADDGASLYMAFRGLQHETASQGAIHNSVANDLQTQITEPFEVWAHQHATRIQQSKEDILDTWMQDFELSISDVSKVRETYLSKSHKANEAEDDARFAPNNKLQEATASPTAKPVISQGGGTIRRSASVAERISQRFKELNNSNKSREPPPPMPSFPEPKNTLQMLSSDQSEQHDDTRSDGTATPTRIDKGKGKEVSTSPLNMSPQNMNSKLPELSLTIPDGEKPIPPLVLADIAIPAPSISALLFKAQSDLPLRNVRFTLLGEYENCFSGEEFVTWVKDNVKEFEGSLDKAAEAAKDLTEKYDALRRIGELGNKFENSPTAYYQFRPKAFNLQSTLARTSSVEEAPLTPITQGILQRSGTVVSYIAKTLGSSPDQTEPPYIRARKEAELAEQIYRRAVRQLDKQRLVLEEKIEDILKALQRWETDRLRAVKTVLLQYQGIIASITSSLTASNEKSSILLSSFIPENDIGALIERYRTGPFRPSARIYESVTHGTDVAFGIDLRKWAAEGAFSPAKPSSISSMDELQLQGSTKGIPPVLKGLLDGLNNAYPQLADDDQRRKTWIYEVPLMSVHHLREALNALPLDSPVPMELLAKYDPPVLASTVKLWALELDPPLGMWEGWTDVRKIYPHVGAHEEKDRENMVDDLKGALIRLPKVHLVVLDAIVSHLKTLINTTSTDEDRDVYINKVAVSMGRSLLRPQVENSLSIQDQHPNLLLIDLLRHYDEVLPPTIEQKKKEMDRPMPTRKRTQLVDARIHRGSIDGTQDPRKLLEAQFALQNPRSRPSSPSPTDRPRFVSPPTSPRNSMTAGTNRPTFISPPSSPPAGATTHPSVPAIQTMGVSNDESRHGSHGASVRVHPPTPVNLNDETSPVHKPASEAIPAPQAPAAFVPPPPPPTITSQQQKPGSPRGSPKMSSASLDSSGLSRSGSAGGGDAGRVRGPRVAGARGPRPLATSASATVNQQSAPSSGATRGTAASHQRNNSFGRSSVVSAASTDRPRTPPDSKNYAPRKTGGRAPAGSFSRTRSGTNGSGTEE